MLEDFFQMTENGIYCPYGQFYLDAQKPVQNVIITHAHADHAVKNNQNIYCTAPTMQFMKHRYKAFAGTHFNIFNCQESFKINGVEITFFPAGHILGSVQVLMHYKNTNYLYTGDFKTVSDPSCQAYMAVETDVLLTESTFANPEIIHPDPRIEIQKLNSSTQNILLGTYSLGKAQRLTHLINQYCPDKKIATHHTIHPINKIYEANGIDLGNYQLYSRKLIKECTENVIYMVPPLTFGSYIRTKNLRKVFASGWNRLQQGNDLSLYISDHADWNELLNTIQSSKAKKVITTHGNGNYLKNYFGNNLDINELK